MKKEHALNSMPFLSIDRDFSRTVKEKNPTNNMVQLQVTYINLGKVPVRHFTNKFTLNKQTINPKKVETILFPQQKGAIHSNFYKSESEIGEGNGLKGEIEIIYWTDSIPEQKFSYKRNFKLAPRLNTFIINEEIKEIK